MVADYAKQEGAQAIGVALKLKKIAELDDDDKADF